jgi:hypothetical protein
MSLVKIKPSRVTDVFISEEPIGNLCVVCISATARKIKLSTDATPELVAGVNIGGDVLSGQPARVVTHGEVSGLICNAAVTVGDRVTGAISGRVTPINTITPAGAVSGYIPAGATGLMSGVTGAAHSILSGYAGGLLSGAVTITVPPVFSSGSFVGTAFNTQRVLGKALDTGLGAGSGIRVLVAIGG